VPAVAGRAKPWRRHADGVDRCAPRVLSERMDRIDLTPAEPFSALIFDCDGTLAETAPLHYHACSKAMATFGAVMPRPWYLARLGLSLVGLMAAFEADFGVRLDPQAVRLAAVPFYAGGFDKVREITAVTAVARRYTGRVPLAVASSGNRDNVRNTLRALGLAGLFAAVVTIEDVGRGKPAPDLFLEAARRLRVPPAACVVFEDTDEGLQAARRAGMAAKDVRTAYRPAWASAHEEVIKR